MDCPAGLVAGFAAGAFTAVVCASTGAGTQTTNAVKHSATVWGNGLKRDRVVGMVRERANRGLLNASRIWLTQHSLRTYAGALLIHMNRGESRSLQPRIHPSRAMCPHG